MMSSDKSDESDKSDKSDKSNKYYELDIDPNPNNEIYVNNNNNNYCTMNILKIIPMIVFNLSLFSICIYDLVYIVLNFSNTQCISETLYIIYMTISSCEIMISLCVIVNIKNIYKYLVSSHNLDSDNYNNINEIRAGITGCQFSIGISEIFVSYLAWSSRYPESERCEIYWLSDTSGMIFHGIHTVFAFLWIFFFFLSCLCCVCSKHP